MAFFQDCDAFFQGEVFLNMFAEYSINRSVRNWQRPGEVHEVLNIYIGKSVDIQPVRRRQASRATTIV